MIPTNTTELEDRIYYATQQREAQANDAAGWYAVAQSAKRELVAAQDAGGLAAETIEKQRLRLLELEAVIEGLSKKKR